MEKKIEDYAIRFAEWIYKNQYTVRGGGEYLWWQKVDHIGNDHLDTEELYCKFLESIGRVKIIYIGEYDNGYPVMEMIIDKYNDFEGADIYDMQVLRSAAGYYIGKLTLCDGTEDYFIPEMRDSAYYWDNRKEAEKALYTGKYEVKF